MMKLMDDLVVSWAVVLTKVDKIKSEQLQKICDKTQQEISLHGCLPTYLENICRLQVCRLRAHLASLSLPRTNR